MPSLAPKPCMHSGCRALVRDGSTRCPQHKRVVEKQYDQDRGSSTERGYGSKWQKARAAWLRAHPLCVMCQQEGALVAATVVDHKIPHRGDKKLFWDSDNWQSLCKRHHDADKQRAEAAGLG